MLVSFRRKLIGKINRKWKHSQILFIGDEFEESYETKLIFNQQLSEQNTPLNQELDKLSKRQKEAIYLRYYQELTYQQITEVMQLQYQTVRDLIYKAIKTLRQNIHSTLFMSMLFMLFWAS